MGDGDFDSAKFEQSLTHLKNSQHSIQNLSSWCMQNRGHHRKIVTIWLTVLKQVKIDQRLVLFNLANDVIQNSKRKNYDFVGSWGTALQRATTMVRDDPKVKQKIARIFKIWEERGIYNEEFLTDLNGLLNTVTAAKRLSADSQSSTSAAAAAAASGPSKTATEATATDPDDFQSTQLINYINNCVQLQERTDKAFKKLSKAPDVDVETIRQSGKDREHVEGVQKEVNESVGRLEHYIQALKAEIKLRNIVIAALGQADEFYRSQRGDVKTVAIAYRNFGVRIKTMKKKLDELTVNLPSPIPSPDINAPSPPPDADLELPDENSFSSFFNNGSAASSFLNSGQLPFNISDFDVDEDQHQRNTIQVIGSRAAEENEETIGGGSFKGLLGLPPQPVPPVASSITGQNMLFGQHHHQQQQGNMFSSPVSSSSNQNNNNNQMGYNPSGGSASSNYGGYSGVPPPLLVPPPIPPMMNDSEEEYTPSSSWNAHTNSWTPSPGLQVTGGNSHNNSSGSVSLPNKPPASPPYFERKGSAPVAEYSEERTGNDVDQRQQNPLLSKIESRLVDVDHRNLISLTGSPGGGGGQQQASLITSLPPPMGIPPQLSTSSMPILQKPALLPTPLSIPQGMWQQQQQPPLIGNNGNNNNNNNNSDNDFRSNYMQQGIPPPPMPPPPVMPGYYGGPGNNNFGNFPMGMFNSPTKKSPQGKNGQDNIDTVDMEMSDEEQDGGGGGGGGGSQMDENGSGMGGGGGPPFMNFPPPGSIQGQQQQPPWGAMNNNNNNNGMHDSPGNGNNSNGGQWNNSPMGGPPPPQHGGAFFGGGGPMFRPPNGNFRARGGFGRGGGPGIGPPGNGMFRGRGSPFRGGGGPFRGNRGGRGGGMWL